MDPVSIGAIYVLLAFWGRRDPRHVDLVTAAGVAFVITGAITLFTLLGVSIAESVFGSGLDALRRLGSKPSEWWTISLLLECVGLVAYAAQTRRRGPGYAGAAGLAVFAALAGINIDALFSGGSRSTVAGWPLVLLIGGGVLVVASFLLRPGALDDVRIVRAAPPPDEPPST